LHFIALTLSFVFAWIWFQDLEKRQDPVERASVNFMIEVLGFSEMQGVALSNITTDHFLSANISANFSKANATAAKYTLGNCGRVSSNFFWLHILFLSVFMGTVIQRMFKLIHRFYVLANLPVDDFHKWEGYEALGETAEQKDEFTYSMRNWNGDHNKVDHMNVIMKIVTSVFIIIPDILFTVCAMYTGVKLFSVSAGSPYALAKQALKAAFLLKFPKLYYTIFTSHNMKIYLVNGEYWIPKTKEEVDEDKEQEEEEKDLEDSEKLTGWDMWYSWGSFFVIIILGFGLSILWVYIKEAPKNELEAACNAYRLSPAAMAYPSTTWTGTTSEFPAALPTWTSANFIQKVFYVPRS